MTKRALMVLVLVAASFVGIFVAGFIDHYFTNSGWEETLFLMACALTLSFIPFLGAYLHEFKAWRRSQLQKVLFVSAPSGVGVSYVIGSLLGHPTLGGVIGFAGVFAAIAYYFLGRGASDGRMSE